MRCERDARFQYNRNFQPHLPFGQFMSYLWQHESIRVWEKMHREGLLGGAPARFFAATKPVEELYDVKADPWQVNNLAADPKYAAEVSRMRAELIAQMGRTGDLGLLPEGELWRRAAGSTPYEMATDAGANPLGDLIEAAGIANAMRADKVPDLVRLLSSEDSAVRWWGATGLAALGEEAAPAEDALRGAIEDGSADVRIAAAEALAGLGDEEAALGVVAAELKSGDVFARLAALHVAHRMGGKARPLLPAIREASLRDPGHKDASDYIERMVGYLPARLSPP